MSEKKERVVTARLPIPLLQRLNKRAADKDMTKGAVIRQALKRYLK
jgi:predicted DNA binding CopG/RHH family protein